MTKISIIFFTVLLSLLWNNDLIAQSFSAKIRKLSIEDGLSNRFVRRTFQDSRGFIWLGTNYGLNRYDGYDFKLLTKENESLFSNTIHNLYEDSDTCLWVTFLDAEERPLEKINIVNLNTLEVQSLEEKFNEQFPVKPYEIFDLYQAAPQVLFIVTKSRKVFKYEGEKNCKKLLELPYPSHTLDKILICKDRICIIGRGYLLEYDLQGELQREEKILFSNILDVRWDENKLVGYGFFPSKKESENDSLIEFSKKNNEPICYNKTNVFSKKRNEIHGSTKIRQAPNGLIWCNTQHTSKLYSAKGELVYDFTNLLLPEQNYKIFSIYFDDNHSTWIATSEGVFILTVASNRFHTYFNKNEYVPNSKAYSIRGIVEDDNGFLYVNTYDGRQRINLETGNFVSLEDTIGVMHPELDIIKDSKGNIWFCGQRNIVQCYNPKTNEMKEIPCKHGMPSITYNELNLKLYEDSKGRMWMGTQNGIYYLDTTAQAFIKFNAYGLCDQLNQSMVYALVEDETTGVLWAGTTTGLYKFDYALNRFTYRYSPDQKRPYYIPHDYILTIYLDKEWLWLGTHEGGLIKWKPQTGDYEHFSVATGLSDNVIYGILEDENNYLWLSSNYGLMQFDKKSYWVKVYHPSDGITMNEFNKMAWYKSKAGRFYFGGVNGMVAFYPNHFQEEGKSDIPMHVLSYACLSEDAEQLEDRTKELYEKQSIVLAPNDHFFKLNFALLDYRASSQNKYLYKIEAKGTSESWQTTSANELRINRLPYGEYTLIIRGQGAGGQWSRHEIRIPIVVQAPFYQTIGFFILLAVGFILVTLISARVFILNSQKNKEYLEQQIASRTQKLLEREQDLLNAKEEAEKSSHAKAEFLSIMSHEIRTPMNAVVNLTNFLLEDNPETRQVENLNILKFSANNLLAIINDVLDFNKIESGKVEFETIDFDLLGLLDSIHYGMAVNAKKKGVHFFLDADLGLETMLVGDPNRLTQILNNLISNAIKFTEQGYVKLKLTILKENDSEIQIVFEVEDTGIGISEEEKTYIFNMFTQAASDTTRKYGGTGLGLAITKRLLQLQNSDIDLFSEVGKGSTFSFVLNFKKGASFLEKRILGVSKEDSGNELKGMRILVVEDNIVNVLVVKKFLEKWGVIFAHAQDGLDALEKTKNEVFDLILMDIHMPNMDGYGASKGIRAMKDGHYDQIPIIALTASALMDNKERVYDAGMNDIVVKPFKPAELHKVLVKYLVKTYKD